MSWAADSTFVLLAVFAAGVVFGLLIDAANRWTASRAIGADTEISKEARRRIFAGLADDELDRVARSLAEEMQKRPAVAEGWEL